MDKPDILVFMSDQHNPLFSSFMGGEARTPNMEKLASEGTVFSEAYTACPLCVPARISMLLSKNPSQTGIFNNRAAIPDTNPTFLHSLVKAGYETVLIGRMHFVGKDQYHGFTRRIVGDQTPVSWGMMPKEKNLHGVWNGFSEPMCVGLIGGGDSPVLAYDRAVIAGALDYLAEKHEKPQCIFVSTYGPHFPYCAPPELYSYYKTTINLPVSYHYDASVTHPIYENRVYDDITEEKVVQARSAYYGMIEKIDEQLGQVRSAYNSYLSQNGREGVFMYLSDHGDHCGDKKMFGKTTFYDNSVKIPFIMQGSGIKAGQIVSRPASIIDVGPTLCEIAGTTAMTDVEGESLVSCLRGESPDDDRAVLSELALRLSGKIKVSDVLNPNPESFRDFRKTFTSMFSAPPVFGKMVRKGDYKYSTFYGMEQFDQLYNIKNDPEERFNLSNELPEIRGELREIACKGWNVDWLNKEFQLNFERTELLASYEDATGLDDTFHWKAYPESSRTGPTIV